MDPPMAPPRPHAAVRAGLSGGSDSPPARYNGAFKAGQARLALDSASPAPPRSVKRAKRGEPAPFRRAPPYGQNVTFAMEAPSPMLASRSAGLRDASRGEELDPAAATAAAATAAAAGAANAEFYNHRHQYERHVPDTPMRRPAFGSWSPPPSPLPSPPSPGALHADDHKGAGSQDEAYYGLRGGGGGDGAGGMDDAVGDGSPISSPGPRGGDRAAAAAAISPCSSGTGSLSPAVARVAAGIAALMRPSPTQQARMPPPPPKRRANFSLDFPAAAALHNFSGGGSSNGNGGSGGGNGGAAGADTDGDGMQTADEEEDDDDAGFLRRGSLSGGYKSAGSHKHASPTDVCAFLPVTPLEDGGSKCGSVSGGGGGGMSSGGAASGVTAALAAAAAAAAAPLPSRFREDFEELAVIGGGSFGTVYKVRSRLDGALYAVKCTRRCIKGARDRDVMLKEVHALAGLTDVCEADTKHVVRYHQAWIEGERLFIQTELCDTSLDQQLLRSAAAASATGAAAEADTAAGGGAAAAAGGRDVAFSGGSGSSAASENDGAADCESGGAADCESGGAAAGRHAAGGAADWSDAFGGGMASGAGAGGIGEGRFFRTAAEAWDFLRQVLLGLDMLHKHNMVHLDVKPGNIFLKGGLYKLGDFGLVTPANAAGDVAEGDSRYMSRELLNESFSDLTKCDIFSLGITLYELLAGGGNGGGNGGSNGGGTGGGALPPNGQEWHRLRDGSVSLLPPPAVPRELADVVRRMMQPDAARRPSAAALLAQVPELRSDMERKLHEAQNMNKLLELQIAAGRRQQPAGASDGRRGRLKRNATWSDSSSSASSVVGGFGGFGGGGAYGRILAASAQPLPPAGEQSVLRFPVNAGGAVAVPALHTVAERSDAMESG